ncbi:regulator of chromosome condensation 1/beta-lactamase-inhibitor protein II [Flammula alnicola]|nr:regulator of chromosome condensation 1/beta-lactamase-inhibitor protein II [Flammula alnicola]
MFKQGRSTLNPYLRRFHTHPSSSYTFRPVRRNGVAITVASALAAGTALWYSTSRPLYNDAIIRPADADKPKPLVVEKPTNPDTIYSLVWGSNNERTLCPDVPGGESIRTPTVARWLDGVAVRDLQLHQKHAACVDARGDVYQWGDGFFGRSLRGAHTPKLTLRGKNIVQLQLTDDKLYALSASGKVYTLATDAMDQELSAGSPTPSSDSWWGTGWLWGEDETVDFAELTASEPLGWRESFVSIAAGKNHLLALTSKGRVFAHPVNKKANHYGQLGFRKFSIPDPVSALTQRNSHLHVELVPKSLADPFINSARAVRVTPSSYASDNLSDVDDRSIRFCPTLFEIPVLRGVEVAQIAASGRSSFIRTPSGRVLGWGANEYGQIGLGSNVALDTITVPTEVVLWRFTQNSTRSKCLDVTAGGDLTAFTVERESDKGPNTTDLLMCGNGQYGGLGNNTYTNVQGNPSRVKSLSGLLQYNEDVRVLEPIKPSEISISPTGHILLSLNSSDDSAGVGGKDLMVWGKNHESELGNGKKSSLVIPTPVQSPDEDERFMLMRKKAKEVKDLHGKVWKHGVTVEQHVAAGYENSIVYWKIVV